jgi:hypothetical protein
MDKVSCVGSTTDPYGCKLGFLDQSLYLHVALQLYSRSRVYTVPDQLLTKSGTDGIQTRISGSVARNFGNYTEAEPKEEKNGFNF